MVELVKLRVSPLGRGSPSVRPSAAPVPESPEAPRFYIETFGCQMNEADSAMIMGRLRERGYVRVGDPAEADVILINTCAVREKAEERVHGRTTQLTRHRATNPHLVIGITGCMAEHLREALARTAPHVALVAGPDSYRRIADLVDRARAGERVLDVQLDREEVYEGLDAVADDDGVSGYVTIQRGCDKFCTFCVVPFTRGRERGVPPREILRQVRRLVDRGYREVVLLGQTVNSYRFEEVTFARLLRSVAGVDGVARLRFTSPYPLDFTDELIGTLAEVRCICPHVHLPVQCGADAVLARMRRGYTRSEFVALVRKLRDRIPDVALSTDIMVGFCGETEADHRETLSLLDEIRFDSAFTFRYSSRDLTFAARHLDDDVPEEVKARRLSEVIDAQERHTRASHAARVGRREEVLIGGPSHRGDRLVGRTPRFQNVLLPLGAGRPGELVQVRIRGTTGHSLLAG